ncbi:DUF4240 domain-containing protein [Alteromonas sediminis]|uniref:DUF4240 domain-containing protein n=1 Tax=Alteromonas sediminis TaxID=2259342 RepID=A0A3N5ZBX2_9ALTE|nr:DUF4240 domain-containing protein [Alteromonas sediminis]RPJ67218.1 DUF4240 domain-containing protein [Alteromonas sediminis]
MTFWEIVELAKTAAGDDRFMRIDKLREQLLKLTAAQVSQFEYTYRKMLVEAYTWDLWGAADVIHGGCSDDGFDYYCDFLISEGQIVFEQALKKPDSIASLKDLGEGGLESYRYVADEVYKELTGRELEVIIDSQTSRPQDPLGEQWDSEDELEERYPDLYKKCISSSVDINQADFDSRKTNSRSDKDFSKANRSENPKKEVGSSGDMHNASRASSATNFAPERLRLLRYQFSDLYDTATTNLFYFAIGLLLSLLLWYVKSAYGIFSLIAGLYFLYKAVAIIKELMRYLPGECFRFKNGLITASIVEEDGPVRLINIAVLSNKGEQEDSIYGVQRREYRNFPCPVKKGEHHACVSVFSDECVSCPGTWESFYSTPVLFGTGNPEKLSACLDAASQSSEKGGANYFDIIERFLGKHSIPEGSTETYVCNAAGDLLEVRDSPV